MAFWILWQPLEFIPHLTVLYDYHTENQFEHLFHSNLCHRFVQNSWKQYFQTMCDNGSRDSSSKMKILWSFTQYYIVPNLYAFLSFFCGISVTFHFLCVIFPYSENEWWPRMSFCLTSPFCLTKKAIQFWNNMGMIKLWQYIYFFFG